MSIKMTRQDRSELTSALLSTVEADAIAAQYQEKDDEELATLANGHVPALRAREIFLSEEIIQKIDFEEAVRQQYVIIYKGLLVAHKISIHRTYATPTPIGTQDLTVLTNTLLSKDDQEPKKTPHLNRAQIKIANIHALSQQHRTSLYENAGVQFMNSVTDCGDTFFLDIHPITDFYAFQYIDGCVVLL